MADNAAGSVLGQHATDLRAAVEAGDAEQLLTLFCETGNLLRGELERRSGLYGSLSVEMRTYIAETQRAAERMGQSLSRGTVSAERAVQERETIGAFAEALVEGVEGVEELCMHYDTIQTTTKEQ
ncbi:hypothetical protein ABZS76_32895 [Streptomyces sp. NPDC005562]|uniref:hypothetical protein n=1 Tax=Streptomyces sp. NPDC005562 TaxID=3154890 RepID=UPI0033A64436